MALVAPRDALTLNSSYPKTSRVVMVMHLVLATRLAKAPRWEGTLSQTRIGPVAKALQDTAAA